VLLCNNRVAQALIPNKLKEALSLADNMQYSSSSSEGKETRARVKRHMMQFESSHCLDCLYEAAEIGS